MTAGRGRRPGEIALGLVLALGAAAAWAWLLPIAVPEAPGLDHPWMSPRFLPGLCIAAIGLLGIAIALQGLGAPPGDAASADAAGLKGLPVTAVALAVAFLLADWLGAFLTSAVLVTGLLLWTGERAWRRLLFVGIVLPALIVALLRHAGGVPLPSGILPL